VDFSESKLNSGEETEIFLRLKNIITAGRENLQVLLPYGITKETLDDLEVRYEKLQSLPETIQMVSSNRKSATRSIKELNSEARNILDLLDDAIEGIVEDEKIIEAWFDARKIKGRHNSKKEDENGNGIAIKE
jgi:hypothetical protein